MKNEVCGVPIRAVTFHNLVHEIESWKNLEQAGKAYCFVNVNTIVESSEDEDYLCLLRSNHNNLCDGAPINWLVRWQHRGTKIESNRTPGPDVFDFCSSSLVGIVPQYFIGSSKRVLAGIAAELEIPNSDDFFHSPPFTSDLTSLKLEVKRFLIGKAPGVVWLGLGGKKQDFISIALSRELPFCFLGVGAAFDFKAKAVRRSPKILRRLGLEWLFRWTTEPRRLTQRYFLGNIKFAFLLWKHASRKSAG